jgi:hypothetical protein
MKFGVFVVALALMLLVSTAVLAQEDEFEPGNDENLPWVSYDEAVSEAKTDYKPIMLYFYGDESLDLCKEAETKRFKSSSVKSQAKKFPVVMVDSADEKKLTDKFNVPPGQFAIVLVNFQLKVIKRINTEKDLKKLSTHMKKAYSENSKQCKSLKKIADAYKKAMKYRDAKRMRDCVKILEAIVQQRGKIDSTYIDKADEYLKQLEKAGSAAVSEADSLIDQAESSLWRARRNGSRYFRQEYVTRAQQKLNEIARDYPVQSLAKRVINLQTRLAQITAEFQRLQQEEQKDNDP